MGQLVLYGAAAVLLAVVLFFLAVRFLPAGEQIAPPLRDEPPWDLPTDRPLVPADVDTVRLPVALRGYRFAEVDLLLDRLAGELRDRDDEIARLRSHAPDDSGEFPAPIADPRAFAPPEPPPVPDGLPSDGPPDAVPADTPPAVDLTPKDAPATGAHRAAGDEQLRD